jgi:hypothetical protein
MKGDAKFNHSANVAKQAMPCTSCAKPRLLYFQRPLTEEEKPLLSRALESIDYTCGSPIFEEGHPLQAVVCVRTALSCDCPMKTQYFSANKGNRFPVVCGNCGVGEVMPEDDVRESLLEQYQVVLPHCEECQASGQKHICTRRKNKDTGKKRKAGATPP